jgi:hypothetical protein
VKSLLISELEQRPLVFSLKKVPPQLKFFPEEH